ncbi:MAG TPA: hypothetical protein VG325_16195 [Solirubrobacteraceae bacterium]|nr:hypothetical protein [Solirubrobacteraceae bacterium]
MVWAAVSVSPLVGVARASSARERLAKVLRQRDPGKQVDGETLVATKTGAVVRGARRRINFEMALGNREVLIGGATHDELGAYIGIRGARISGGGGPDLIHGMGLDQRLSGGAGNDMIYGGPGADTIYGGPGADTINGGSGSDTIYGGLGNDTINGGGGNDRIMDLHGVTTVTTGPGAASVDVRDGQGNDRVRCAAGGQTRVLADRGDRLSRGCRRMTAGAARRIFSRTATGIVGRAAMEPVAHTTDAVSGDGSETNPYQQPCTPALNDICYTPGFPARTLQKLWSHEAVPSYYCAGRFGAGYLDDEDLAPAGTTLPKGVAVIGLGPIGMSITETLPASNADNGAAGTRSASPWSSATNWETHANSYVMQLYCTDESDANYTAPGLG